MTGEPINELLRRMSEHIGDGGDSPEAVLEAAVEAARLAVTEGYASGPLWESSGAEFLASYWSAGTGRGWHRAAEEPASLRYGLFECPTCKHEWTEDLPPMWSAFDMWPTCPLCKQDDPAEIASTPERPVLKMPLAPVA